MAYAFYKEYEEAKIKQILVCIREVIEQNMTVLFRWRQKEGSVHGERIQSTPPQRAIKALNPRMNLPRLLLNQARFLGSITVAVVAKKLDLCINVRAAKSTCILGVGNPWTKKDSGKNNVPEVRKEESGSASANK